MTRRCDVVIAGLGIQGAALAAELAARGQNVVALDRHDPPHTLGSSHGQTRVIRAAYFEHPLYVPLALRAFELWAMLERDAGESLLRRTGALMIGPAEGEIVRGTLASVHTHALEHELLDARALRSRFPALSPRAGDVGVLETRAGMLSAESCHRALLRRAQSCGAQLRPNSPLLGWDSLPGSLAVRTAGGIIECDALVLAAGPWLPPLLSDVAGLRLTVERQAVAFFAAAADGTAVHADRCPITLWEYEAGRVFYTLPDVGEGVKAALHHEGSVVDPQSVDRQVSDDEAAAIRSLLAAFLPAAAGRLLRTLVCLYTNTPDQHFLVDAHPADERIKIVSACSGHGFKFAPALAEQVADWLLGGARSAWLEPFRLSRFEAAR